MSGRSALEDFSTTDCGDPFFWILRCASTDLPVQDDMAMLSVVHGNHNNSQFGDIKVWLRFLQKTTYTDHVYFQAILIEMQETMEKERQKTNRLEKEMEEERQKTNQLEKEMEEERQKTNRLEKEMEEERQKTNRLEKEVEKETEKMNRLEKEMAEKMKENGVLREIITWQEQDIKAEQITNKGLIKDIKEERKRTSLLEADVDDLKQSTNVIASWIVAGVRCIISLQFVELHFFNHFILVSS